MSYRAKRVASGDESKYVLLEDTDSENVFLAQAPKLSHIDVIILARFNEYGKG